MERLTVSEAAERLEISEQAVRKRLQRGTLPHGKHDGRVYVYLDSETSTVGQKEEMESDRQTTLNWLDKQFTTWQALQARYKRFAFLVLIVSVVLLALSGGAVSTEETLTISGIGLRIPLVVFMITGALVIPTMLIQIANLSALADFYEIEIRNLYRWLGLADSALNSQVNPFQGGSVVDNLAPLGSSPTMQTSTSEDGARPTVTRTIYTRGGVAIYTALYTILPASAQAGAGYKISELLHQEEPGWFPEVFAYIGEAFAYIGLPRQGSDWISDVFTVLAFVTALEFVLLDLSTPTPEEPRPKKNLGDFLVSAFAYVFTCLFYLLLAWMGIWIGYVVAAS